MLSDARVLFATLAMLGGCSLLDATTFTDLASYGVGSIEIERHPARLTREAPTGNSSIKVSLGHQSEDCPGLDTGKLSAMLSGLGVSHASPGGTKVFVDRMICSSAVLTFNSGGSQWPSPDGTSNAHLELFDASMRIDVDVQRLIAPLALVPSPAELSTLTAGESIELRVPGFTGTDLDAEQTTFDLTSGSGSDFIVRSVPARLEEDSLIVDLPSNLDAGLEYTLRASIVIAAEVTRCEGAAMCTAIPTQLQAEYSLTPVD